MYGIMNDLEIEINGKKIRIKEYKGYRVVTFADIDAVHGRPAGTAQRNFKANRKRFIEGEDFFLVKPTGGQKDEFRLFGFEIPNRGVILLTESGYLMLVKSFTDELSWKVQRQLVNTYFRVNQIATSDNAILLQIIENQMSLESSQKRIERKIDALEKEIRTLDKKVDTVNKKSDNILKTLFDMAKDIIANGFEELHKNLFK